MNEFQRIESEVDAFLADRRHLDYQQTEHNQQLLLNWLEEQQLAVSAASLHEGYMALRNELDLDEKPEPIVVAPPAPAPTQPPAPIPTAPDPRPPQAWRNGQPIPMGSPTRL